MVFCVTWMKMLSLGAVVTSPGRSLPPPPSARPSPRYPEPSPRRSHPSVPSRPPGPRGGEPGSSRRTFASSVPAPDPGCSPPSGRTSAAIRVSSKHLQAYMIVVTHLRPDFRELCLCHLKERTKLECMDTDGDTALVRHPHSHRIESTGVQNRA
jgi:hypothetical protein